MSNPRPADDLDELGVFGARVRERIAAWVAANGIGDVHALYASLPRLSRRAVERAAADALLSQASVARASTPPAADKRAAETTEEESPAKRTHTATHPPPEPAPAPEQAKEWRPIEDVRKYTFYYHRRGQSEVWPSERVEAVLRFLRDTEESRDPHGNIMWHNMPVNDYDAYRDRNRYQSLHNQLIWAGFLPFCFCREDRPKGKARPNAARHNTNWSPAEMDALRAYIAQHISANRRRIDWSHWPPTGCARPVDTAAYQATTLRMRGDALFAPRTQQQKQ